MAEKCVDGTRVSGFHNLLLVVVVVVVVIKINETPRVLIAVLMCRFVI